MRARWGITTVAAIVAAAVYAWWATSLRPFTTPALVATLAGGAAALAVGARRPRRPPSAVEARFGPSGAWAVLLVALAAWELVSFVQHPRAAHPTLSSIADEVLGQHPARAVAMVVWLGVGVALARP